MPFGLFERPPVKSSAASESQSHFAWLRTRMAIERTLLSCVRTATALIGFGFTMFTFFERLNQMPSVLPPRSPGLARTISLTMVAAGTVSLVLALGEYRTLLNYLWSTEFKSVAGIGDRPSWSATFVIGVLITLIGLTVFVSLMIRTAFR